MMSFKEFTEETKKLPSIEVVAISKEEFAKILQPVICEQCRRIFAPTEEEKEQLARAMEDFNNEEWEWEVISPLK